MFRLPSRLLLQDVAFHLEKCSVLLCTILVADDTAIFSVGGAFRTNILHSFSLLVQCFYCFLAEHNAHEFARRLAL